MRNRAPCPSALYATTFLAALLSLVLVGAADAQKVDVVAIPTALTLPVPSAMDFEFGLVESLDRVEIVVDTAKPLDDWFVFVHSDDPSLGGYGKPISDLLWRVQGASSWNPIGASEAMVANGQGDTSIFVEVAIALSLSEDPPGLYAGDLVFRIDKSNSPQ